MRKLVVIFPGAGYGLDCPLLYYADFLFETNGYERLHMNYQHILLDANLSLEDKLQQLRAYIDRQLATVDFCSYDEVVFVSKSVGCVEAGLAAESLNIKPIQIFLTPVAQALPYCKENCSVIIGSNDKAYSTYKEHCDANQIDALYIDGADHSLELAGKPHESIDVLKKVIEFIANVSF